MLCVIAKLDDAATERLAVVRKAAFPYGKAVRPLYGHITLATYVGDNETDFIQSCKDRLKDLPAFDVVFEKVEVLEETSIIVAAPAESKYLYSIHQRIAEKNDDALDRWTKADVWYPHTTLFYGPGSNLADICSRMKGSFVPFAAHISRIEFSRIIDNGYDIVESMELADEYR